MRWPRIQGFEFNDAPWAPVALKETIIEALAYAMEWGHTLDGLVAPLETFLAETHADEILEICAGAGRAASGLARATQRNGKKAPHFILTDILPHVPAWEKLRSELPELLTFIPEPVDATAIPASISQQRPRLILNAFHHFPPQLAAKILEDAVRSGVGVFLAEPFERRLHQVLPFLLYGAPALFATPILSPHQRLLKILLTWCTPASALAGLWDSFMSAMRIHSKEELLAMVEPFGQGYRWTYGHFTYAAGGRGYYFYGLPTQPAKQ